MALPSVALLCSVFGVFRFMQPIPLVSVVLVLRVLGGLAAIARPNAEGLRAKRVVQVILRESIASYITLSFGKPPQQFGATLDTRSALTTVLGDGCGKVPRHQRCPLPLCNRDLEHRTVCYPVCGMGVGSWFSLVCDQLPQYSPKNSTTAVTLDNEEADVYEQYNGTFAYLGIWGSDSVTLMDRDENQWKLLLQYPMGRVRLSQTVVFDYRSQLGLLAVATIGLRPQHTDGTLNFVRQIHNAERIPHAVFSLSPVTIKWSRHRSPHDREAKITTFGGFDKVNCYDWSFHEPLKGSWDIPIRDVYFNGKLIQKQSVAHIRLDSRTYGIQLQLAEELVADGVLQPVASDRYKVDCRRSLSLRFHIGNLPIQLDHADLIQPSSRRCTADDPKPYNQSSLLSASPDILFTDEPEWTLGLAVFERYCIGYDFGGGKMGWAKRRRGRSVRTYATDA